MEGKKEIENNNFKEFLTKYGENSPHSKAVGGIALPYLVAIISTYYIFQKIHMNT